MFHLHIYMCPLSPSISNGVFKNSGWIRGTRLRARQLLQSETCFMRDFAICLEVVKEERHQLINAWGEYDSCPSVQF
jgi:hypothetical protein